MPLFTCQKRTQAGFEPATHTYGLADLNGGTRTLPSLYVTHSVTENSFIHLSIWHRRESNPQAVKATVFKTVMFADFITMPNSPEGS